ncbi:1,3-beta-glucanosyltransferase [Mycena venus]|uniref:1,3-beta-glucanosyltransferase n=1 Tax=Mycena venus TaxID=2733690 RepID=A0A8H6XYS7_9AGAR|nr:1,3-beta-glucanosyltransferase [Mycena venus]
MTNVCSGGCTFSYLSAQSQGHAFGMAALSSNNTSVTINADFDNLVSQYCKVNFASINSQSQSSVAASTFSACLIEKTSLEASAALASTPNASTSTSTTSVYTPPNAQSHGMLMGIVCGLLGSVNGTYADITVNGTTAMCDLAVTSLSYACSQYYDLSPRNPASCDFSGDATISNSATDSPASAVT